MLLLCSESSLSLEALEASGGAAYGSLVALDLEATTSVGLLKGRILRRSDLFVLAYKYGSMMIRLIIYDQYFNHLFEQRALNAWKKTYV